MSRRSLLAHLPAMATMALPVPSLGVLKEAACAAFALPDLGGRSVDAHRARHAVVHAARSNARNRDLADVLGIGMRAIQTLRLAPVDAATVRAVILQAQLRAHLVTEQP